MLKGKIVSQLAAGVGHCLALTNSRELYAWGRDDFGQTGIDPSIQPPFGSVFRPEKVMELKEFGDSEAAVPIRIACGAYHSMVIDNYGALWTWGAAGGACLGHGDVISMEKGRQVTAAMLLKKQKASSAELPVLMEKPVWAIPRRVRALSDTNISHVSGGSHHSAAVTTDGRLFLWGESVSVCRPLYKKDEEDMSEGGEEIEDVRTRTKVDVGAVEIPQQPSANWLPRLADKWIETAVCGGQTTVIITTGERIAMTLGRQLYQTISRPHTDENNDITLEHER